MASSTTTIGQVASETLTGDNGRGAAFRALSTQQPLMGDSNGKAKYLGRVVLELWESPNPDFGDGLHYSVFPAAQGVGATADLTASLLKSISTKLAGRVH